LDANFRFGGLTRNGFAAKTFSPAGTPSGAENEVATRANAEYRNRQWRFSGRYTTIGQGFNDELGFIPRTGVNETNVNVNRTLRPNWLPRAIRELGPHWVFVQSDRADGRGLDLRQQDFHFSINFANGSFLEPGANTNVEVIRTPFTLNSSRGVRIPEGRYEYTEYFLTYRPNDSARSSMGLRYSVGKFYGGYKHGYAIGPTFRPNEKLNASVTMQLNQISLPTASYLSTLTTSRVNYNFNTKVFINALLQYNTDSHQLSSNIRFNIIHRPLSDFFFVYNEHRDENAGLLQDRSLIAKMTYMVAF